MEPEIQSLKQPSTGPYPKPNSPHTHTHTHTTYTPQTHTTHTHTHTHTEWHNFTVSCILLSCHLCPYLPSGLFRLTFWHRSFTFNSNKSPTWWNNFSVYYPNVFLQLNKFRAFFRPSSGAQWLQWQPLVLLSYRGDSRVVLVVGPAGRHDHEHSTTTQPQLMRSHCRLTSPTEERLFTDAQ